MPAPTAFISYSWDSEDHKQWIKELVTRLRTEGIDVTFDQDTVLGDHLPRFMEDSIKNNDFVLIICTPNYKRKSEARIGGAGYEGDIITSEIFLKQNRRKYIPILREGDWLTAVPIWLSGAKGVDLTNNNEVNFRELVMNIKNDKSKPSSSGQQLSIDMGQSQPPLVSRANEDDEIKIIGIILKEVTSPRLDGTKGSALYKVPFELSKQPSANWRRIFEHHWNHPPRFSSMHRPGIAQVVGDKVILDGTTIEEIEKYHLETLKLVLKETNKTYKEFKEKEAAQAKAQSDREKKHKDNLQNTADKLDFDD